VLREPKLNSFTRLRLPGVPRHRKRLILLFVLHIFGFTFSGPLAWSQSSTTIGYEVKAAFLFNFAKFIDWPSGSFVTPQSPFTLCVLGQDPFGNILDDSLRGKMIGARPLAVRRIKDKAEARSCQIVFVSSTESAHLPEILGSLSGANLLIVGESNGFAASGGTIEFTLEDNHVRFNINIDAADRSGLKFSSKLLALAKIVHNNGHSKGG
jgi:YfiR/HmsC-like